MLIRPDAFPHVFSTLLPICPSTSGSARPSNDEEDDRLMPERDVTQSVIPPTRPPKSESKRPRPVLIRLLTPPGARTALAMSAAGPVSSLFPFITLRSEFA